MNIRRAVMLAVLGALATTTVAAAAERTTPRVSSGDVVADRQRLMKNNGAQWQEIQAKVKAGNIEGIAANAEAISLHALNVVGLFPEGSLTDKSKAKPEIWQKWTEFQKEATNLHDKALELRNASMAKDADKTQALVKEFGRAACGACHTPFRVPPPQQPPASR